MRLRLNRTTRAAVLLALIALIAAPGCGVPLARQKSTDDVKVIHDVRYWSGQGSSKSKNSLDIFLPTHGSKWPTVVVIHGGAWTVGSKKYMGNVAYALAENGFAVANINYRLSPAVQHPAHVKDCARAVAWAKQNLPKYGADTDKIFLLGHSAGGHLVSLLGVKSSYLEDAGVSPKSIAGVVSVSGVYDINDPIFKSVFGSDRDGWKKASPINYVDKNDPPFLILFAQHEMQGAVPLARQADDFYQELRENKVEASINEIPGANHNTIVGQVGKGPSRTLDLVLKFLDEHD